MCRLIQHRVHYSLSLSAQGFHNSVQQRNRRCKSATPPPELSHASTAWAQSVLSSSVTLSPTHMPCNLLTCNIRSILRTAHSSGAALNQIRRTHDERLIQPLPLATSGLLFKWTWSQRGCSAELWLIHYVASLRAAGGCNGRARPAQGGMEDDFTQKARDWRRDWWVKAHELEHAWQHSGL